MSIDSGPIAESVARTNRSRRGTPDDAGIGVDKMKYPLWEYAGGATTEEGRQAYGARRFQLTTTALVGTPSPKPVPPEHCPTEETPITRQDLYTTEKDMESARTGHLHDETLHSSAHVRRSPFNRDAASLVGHHRNNHWSKPRVDHGTSCPTPMSGARSLGCRRGRRDGSRARSPSRSWRRAAPSCPLPVRRSP